MAEDPRNVPERRAVWRIPFGMGDRLALKITQTVPTGGAAGAYDAQIWHVVNLRAATNWKCALLCARAGLRRAVALT